MHISELSEELSPENKLERKESLTSSKCNILTSLRHRLLRKGLLGEMLSCPSNTAVLAILSSVIIPQVRMRASWQEARVLMSLSYKERGKIDKDTSRYCRSGSKLGGGNLTAVRQNPYIRVWGKSMWGNVRISYPFLPFFFQPSTLA